MKNLHETLLRLKDIVTNIAGVVITIAGSIVLAFEGGLIADSKLVVTAKVAGLVAAGLVAYLTGKNPDGSKKTDKQNSEQIESK
jgi:hypothetical protein